MKAEHLLISGRVQGVGYRDWMVRQANKRGLSGWVRNCGHDQVEAVVYGDETALTALIAACHLGPPGAHVTAVVRRAAQPPGETGFRQMPSV